MNPKVLLLVSAALRLTMRDDFFNPSVEVDPISAVPFAAKPLARVLGVPFLPKPGMILDGELGKARALHPLHDLRRRISFAVDLLQDDLLDVCRLRTARCHDLHRDIRRAGLFPHEWDDP